jgi:hypothetical protein
MITERNYTNEINEPLNLVQNSKNADEIKRNNLGHERMERVQNTLAPSEFIVKFARLKKAMRKRSGGIF